MRSVRVLASATALELLSEPLCLLITLSAQAMAVLAPAIHYHQFGEPSRMARDAGFSALLLGGLFYVAFGTLKTYRREIESGTMETALAHSVSRTRFFLSKALGCALAYLCFALTIACVSLTVVNGAEIGGRIAAKNYDIARLWGPSLAVAVASIALPISVAAALNRFARFRFVVTTNLLALGVALAGVAYRFDGAIVQKVFPALVLFALPPLVLLAATSAFAIRFKSNVAGSLTALVAAAIVPLIGNYCLSDALAHGGTIPTDYFWFALAAIVPPIAAFLALGVSFANNGK